MEYILPALLGVALGAIIVYFILRSRQDNSKVSEEIKNNLNEIFPEALAKATKQLTALADQQLKAEKQEIKTDLSNKKSQIEDLVRLMRQELDKTQRKIEENERDRIGSFKTLTEKMEEITRINTRLNTSTESLRKLLSDNQMRGQFGEEVAEDLLKMAGFSKGVDYEFNKQQGTTETRPDFSIIMPDGSKVNVDAKFPFANLQKYTEAAEDDEETRKKYLALFKQDVKEKIKQVTSRDYISAYESTVDFVILFIPNEMIFSYIYDKMHEVWQEAISKKVIFAGPFNFIAILRLIRQAYRNFEIQENTQNIIKYVKAFEEQFQKYSIEFEKVGKKIDELNNQYEKVDRTRTNVLLKTVEKIKLEDSNDKTETTQLKDNLGQLPIPEE